jgi:hypothetical protein
MEIIIPPRSRLSTLGKILRAPIHGAAIATLAFGFSCGSVARAAETPSEPAAESAKFSAAELDELVGPIALYPDELLGIVLPASTFPLQIVQAARFLEKKKDDPDAKPDEEWDTSILGLLNYPDVVNKMNEDLNWTWKLGEAVADQQNDVMDAVQRFRVKADKAGNLKSNDKVKVVKETEADPQIIIIESASPDVIYVPVYQPSTVIVYSTVPYPYYYSAPYPYYYSPRAAFWTGMFVGAAVGYGMHWGHHHYDSSIYVNRDVDINVDRPNRPGDRPGDRPGVGPGGKPGERPGGRPEGAKDWKADKGRGKQSGARPGRESGARPGAGGGSRPETRPGKTGPSSSRRPEGASRAPSQRSRDRDLTSPSRSERASRDSSMGGYRSGGASRSHSSRGASSRGRSGGGRRGGGGRRR